MGKDSQVRVFRFLTGKLHRTYDESMPVFAEMQKVCGWMFRSLADFGQKQDSVYKIDAIDFGRRVAVEKGLDQNVAPPSNVVFDYSGNFVLYPTLLGIKGNLPSS